VSFDSNSGDSNVEHILAAGKSEYEEAKHETCEDSQQIEIDLDRTFSDKIEYSDFHGASSRKRMLRSLLNVFGLSDSKVGYCQGMNYVAGMLLVVSDFQEAEAYAIFKLILQNYGARRFYICNKVDGRHFRSFYFPGICLMSCWKFMRQGCMNIYNLFLIILIMLLLEGGSKRSSYLRFQESLRLCF